MVSPTVSTRTARTVRACSRRPRTSESGGAAAYRRSSCQPAGREPARRRRAAEARDRAADRVVQGTRRVRGADTARAGRACGDGLGREPRPRGRLGCRTPRAGGHRGLPRLPLRRRWSVARAAGAARPARRRSTTGRAATRSSWHGRAALHLAVQRRRRDRRPGHPRARAARFSSTGRSHRVSRRRRRARLRSRPRRGRPPRTCAWSASRAEASPAMRDRSRRGGWSRSTPHRRWPTAWPGTSSPATITSSWRGATSARS